MTRIEIRTIRHKKAICTLATIGWSLAQFSVAGGAEVPLHKRIDAALVEARVAPEPGLTSDAAFLRRTFLDLTGRIPSSLEARDFLSDSAKDKRARLIDRLLASPEHVRHMAITFDVTWVERRSDPHVKADAWRSFLFSQFATNTPYTTLASRIVAADGADAKKNGPAKFILAREAEQHAVTRDVSRMFLGKDVQCAQCHDHPRIDDYTMREYYGVNAFVNRTYLFRPDTKKPGVVAENPTGEANYKSAFTQAEGQSRPRLPGETEITEPVVKKGAEYKVKPDKKNKKLRPIPAYSRRAELAKLFSKGGNLPFRRNIVNRLWAHMMGRGIVEPVDFHHTDNPPTHPELLDLLANEFAAMNFDMRAFLRELALSRAYQRGFDLPSSLAQELGSLEKRLAELDAEYEQLASQASKAVETFDRFKASIEETQTGLGAAKAGIAKQEKTVAAATKSRDAVRKTADAAAKPFNERNAKLKSLAEAATKSKMAAEALKEDKELAKAAAVFEDRRRKLATEVAKLKTDFDAKSAKAREAETALTAANEALQKQKAQTEGLTDRLEKLQARFIAEDDKRTNAKLQASFARQRRDAARELIETARLEASAARSAKQAQSDKTALTESDRTVADLTMAAFQLNSKLPFDQAALNQVLGRKQEVAHAAELASADLRDIAAKLGRADIGQSGKNGDRADALLVKKRQLENRLAALRAQSPDLRADFLQAALGLVEAKAAIYRNTEDLSLARLKNAELSAKLSATQRLRDAGLAKLDAARMDYADSLSVRFDIGGLTPLTPEQLCWSMLEATGEAAKQAKAGGAEFEKKNPLEKGSKSTPEREAEKSKFIEQYVYGKLKGQEGNFVSLFGAAAGSPQNSFFATPDQALFFANGGNVRGWLNPSGGNLTDRLGTLEDPAAFAEELYLSALTRKPTPSEIEDVKAHLAAHGKDRRTAARELAWALLTSIEFRFRH